jgi:hypothetical protein
MKLNVFSMFIAAVLISKNIYAEDPNPIKLNNPIKYSNIYLDKYNNKVISTLKIEKINDHNIKFIMETVFNEHVCDLSGEASSTLNNINDFEFVYEDCHLHLMMSKKNNTIISSDSQRMCPKFFCGFQGRIDGFIFKLNK